VYRLLQENLHEAVEHPNHILDFAQPIWLSEVVGVGVRGASACAEACLSPRRKPTADVLQMPNRLHRLDRIYLESVTKVKTNIESST
jgi:hypothetical protein